MHMHNHHRLFHGGAPPPPPPPPLPPPHNPFIFPPNPNFQFQNPNFQFQNPNPQFQNPNPQFENPNSQFQNPNLFPPNPNLVPQNPNLFPQDPNWFPPNPNLFPQNPNPPHPQILDPSPEPKRNVDRIDRAVTKAWDQNVDRIDRAATKARDGIVAGGGHVAAWKVAEAVAAELNAESWEALGVPMQQVPSLYRLIVTEGKINAFIHCFVAVQRITTLHDLNVAICNNEGVERYEELDMGPLLRHPLVMHYFSVSSDAKDILNITSEEIITCLCEYIDIHEGIGIGIDEFLDYVAKQRSVSEKEKLYVRIQSFGMHVTFIRQAKRLENGTVERCLKDVTVQKRSHFGGAGKHLQFVPPSSEEIDNEKEEDFDSSSHTLYKYRGSSIQPSHCPFPSAAEERSRLELRKADVRIDPSPPSDNLDYKESQGVSKRKRKPENKSGNITARCKLPKAVGDDSDIAIKSKTEFGMLDDGDFVLDENSMRMFIVLWKKKARRANSVSEVFWRMLKFYKINQRKEKAEDWFSSHPFIGLLNVAVISIARGMWDNMCNDFQDFSHHGVADVVSEKHTLYENVGVEPLESDAVAKTKRYIKDVTVNDIVQKISSYFELDHKISSNVELTFEPKLSFLRKLCKCEFWLAKQFSVKKFESLGHGKFFSFLEKHVCVLHDALRKCLIVENFIDQTPIPKRKPAISNSWPPSDWKTAPHSNSVKGLSEKSVNDIRSAEKTNHKVNKIDGGCDVSATEECDLTSITEMVVLPGSLPESTALNSFLPSAGGNISGKLSNPQAIFTGRLGEHVAYNYFSTHAGNKIVTWVNQDMESGLPYDLVIEDEQRSFEYVEVKATRSLDKGWFHISTREWSFALEKGEHFTIAHVILSGNDEAKIIMFKNPIKLCQLGKLQLAVMMPKLLEEFAST